MLFLINQHVKPIYANLFFFFKLIKLTIGINFFNEFFQDAFVEGLTHQTQDVSNHIARDASAAAGVEAIESLLEDWKKLNKIYEKVQRM